MMNKDIHAYQRRYWNELTELRVSVYYLELLESKLRRKDFFLRAFLLLASASSIATWALWDEYPVLWASIIGAAQVLTVIEPIMPFKKLLKGVSALAPTRKNHAIDVEEAWHDVAKGKFSDSEINTRCAEIQRSRLRDVTSHLKEIVIPEDSKIMHAATSRADRYFQSRYGGTQ